MGKRGVKKRGNSHFLKIMRAFVTVFTIFYDFFWLKFRTKQFGNCNLGHLVFAGFGSLGKN